MDVHFPPAPRAAVATPPPMSPDARVRARAVDRVDRAEAKEEVARTGETVTAVSTAVGAPLIAGGVAVAVASLHGALLTGILATGGTLLLLALVGILIYLLVFRHNEKAAHAQHLAGVNTLLTEMQAAPPPTLDPDPIPKHSVTPPTPAQVKAMPQKPPYVTQPNATQLKLDAVMAEATAAYALVDAMHAPFIDKAGKPISVSVSPAFRLNGGLNQPTPHEAYTMITATLKDAGMWQPALAAGLDRLVIGRASFKEIAQTTQLLLRANGITPDNKMFKTPFAYWVAVRELQWKYGIGLDCAGFVAEAMAALVKNDQHLSDVFERGFGLAPERDSRFLRTATDHVPADLQPGDLIALKDPSGDVGHFLITYETHPMTDADTAYYGSTLVDPDGVLAGGPVQLYVFDSSWGAGGDPQRPLGGVCRRVMFFNQRTHEWSQLITSAGQAVPTVIPTEGPGPYNHIVIGVYRARG